MVLARSSSAGMSRRRSSADAKLADGPAAKRFKAVSGQPLRRPTRPTQKPWPVSKLNAFCMPLEEYGWGKLLDRILESRGWKVLRPCTVVADKGFKGEPDEISMFLDEFEGLLQGQNILGAAEEGQVEICKRTPTFPSHAVMFMNSVLERDDIAKLFLANKKRFCKPGTAYSFAAIPGSETSLFKCNFSRAFRNDDWYPTAYSLPHEEHLLMKDIKASGTSYWIAKPNDEFGGTGITVWSHDDPGFHKLIRDARKQPRSIVQRYLHDPMLLGKFKFHMRIHLVITSLSPLQAFVHAHNGQALCATRPFTLSKKTLNASFDRAVHLTNQCFNANPKNKDNFLRKKPLIGKGQQITIPQLEAYLQKNHKGFNKKELWKQIVHIGKRQAEYIASARTVRPHIGKVDSNQLFEVFGMDLMLDKNCKVWMCETNNSPGLSYPATTILGAPNPDYGKELAMCKHVHHDTLTLLGLDAGKKQKKGSLSHWYEIDFSA